MTARAARAQLAGPRRILAARRALAAGRVVGAAEPERTRSRFRAHRGEMRQSRPTASQAEVPLRRRIAPHFVARKNTFSFHAKCCPKSGDFVAAPASLQGGWRLVSGRRPWLTETGRGATGESRSSNLATVPGRTIGLGRPRPSSPAPKRRRRAAARSAFSVSGASAHGARSPAARRGE